MSIYETRGFNPLLYQYTGDLEPFEYIASFSPRIVPKGTEIENYKRTQAPYCLSGKVNADKHGSYKRNNDSLVYRDLIFLDYDELEPRANLPKIVSETLNGYSYIIYPTIKHTAEKPRYRLVVKPSNDMGEATYKAVVAEIADKIGLPFDMTSLTWSQLQGLPVTTGDPKDYEMIVNRGKPYPVPKSTTASPQRAHSYGYTPNNGKISATMRVVDTLLNGFGSEGGRNNTLSSFVGTLLNPYIGCDVRKAYELANIANSVSNEPLPQQELDRTFNSILKAETRRRGGA